MSGLYIPGMKMPKDGKVVLIDPWGNVRLYWSKDVAAFGTGLHLCKASELPPHGRLGDLDALIADISFFDGGDWHYGYSAKQIENAPTIIPADGGDGHG